MNVFLVSPAGPDGSSVMSALFIAGLVMLGIELILFVPCPCISSGCMHLGGGLLFFLLGANSCSQASLVVSWIIFVCIPFILQLLACYKHPMGTSETIERNKLD